MLPWNADDLAFDESTFSGVGRLFPLPNLVMFPHVMQPLHIFEQRYRTMLNEALDSDGLLAMGVVTGDFESERPPVCPHVCLGKVVTHHRLDDGRYNVLLLGMRRARIVSELPDDRPFRRAELELLDDFAPTAGDDDRAELQRELTERFGESLQGSALVDEAIRSFLSDEAPLGVLTDLVSFAAPLGLEEKCALLAEGNVDRRAKLLNRWLRSHAKGASTQPPAPKFAAQKSSLRFPPRFSSN
ncbi:MAG: LON peptidase substrate-binding domain-containing protein [Pirellulales bacterium]|nr:LON peptidase substrate-binding domain-containing protein [Pirellulales bacterium]MBX3432646.1 LON peptidase substrate-binding domain-containing protein [Pirellulales bacterium]